MTLTEAIAAYRAGITDFNLNSPADHAGADAYIDRSYGPPHRALQAWHDTAASEAEAILAVHMARDAVDEGDSELGLAMINAALGWFDGSRQRVIIAAVRPWARVSNYSMLGCIDAVRNTVPDVDPAEIADAFDMLAAEAVEGLAEVQAEIGRRANAV